MKLGTLLLSWPKLPEEAWSSGQSDCLWIIEAGGPGFESSSDQVVFSSLLINGSRHDKLRASCIDKKNKKNNS